MPVKNGKSDTSALYSYYLRSRQVPEELQREGKKAVREVSEGVCSNVKRRMPVRTGRARAGWGKYTPGDLAMANRASTADDAVWKVSPKGWSIKQGTRVPYTVYLNEGHSRQAPVGFIDAAVSFGREELKVRITSLRRLAKRLLAGG